MDVDRQEFVDLYSKLLEQERRISESIAETYNDLRNSRVDNEDDDENLINLKSCQFIEAMRLEIEEDYDPLTFEPIKNFIEAKTTLKNEIGEMEKCISYKRSAIDKIEEDIQFYKSNIENLESTMSEYDEKQKKSKKETTEQQLNNAQKKMEEMKGNIENIVTVLYPNYKNYLLKFINSLCANYFSESEDYVEIDERVNPDIIETLLISGIIVSHPYQNKSYPSNSSIYLLFLKSVLSIYLFYFLGLMTYINLISVKLYVKLQNIFAACKIFACVVVIVGGIYELSKGNTSNLSTGFEGTLSDPGNIALAFYSGLWAYDGWTAVTTVTEEIQNPSVNIPRSVLIAVPLITGLYVFMNVAYLAVLSVPEMLSASAVAVAFGEKALGPFTFLIPIGVAIATFGCAMSLQFGVTRLCYVAGKDGHTLELFSFVHIRKYTPAPAVAFQGAIALLFIVGGDITQLIEFASFLIWIFYGGAMIALMVLRKTQPDLPRPYKVPLIIPIFVLCISLFLSVVPIIKDPSIKYLFALGFILIGVGVYTYFIYWKKRPKIMDSITIWTQALFEVVPPSRHIE